MKTIVSRLTITVTVLSMLALAPAYEYEDQGTGGKRAFTKHFRETLFEITEQGSYSIEILLDEKEYKIGKNVIGIVVHNAHDSDVKGANILIVHKNLETGELAIGTPAITDKGNGLYIVSDLNLQRDGRWELTVTVKNNGVEDRARFVFPDVLKKRLPKGKYMPE